MQCAWNLRRFVWPIAGVVCWASLSFGVELLKPPRPPADNDGLILDERAPYSPQPVTIEPVVPEPLRLEPVLIEPNSSVGFSPKSPDRAPANLPPPDPVPFIEPAPVNEPPLTVYPESLPPVVYAPGCHTVVMPTCTTGMYGVSPACDDGCGCEQICGCACVRTWTLRAELLIWDHAGSNTPLINAPVVVNSGDIDGGWQVGPRLTAIRHGVFGSCWDLEVAYFGIDSWSGSQTVAGVTSYLTNPPVLFGASSVTASYTSSLHNGEINGRRAHNDWITWIVGFRALQIDELLAADIAVGPSAHSVATQNRLYGGQIGLDALLFDGECWYVNAVGKVGIFGNSADQVTRTTNIGGALPFITYTGNQTSFVGEFGVNAGYRMSERWSLLAGYNLLWINGVAVAPDQLAATNLTTGVGTLATNGNLFYHGVNVGLEYGW
jgi:hypothetical protein